MKSIYLQLPVPGDHEVLPVIATVVRTRGSAPQVPGSSALFDGKGLISGTVGGGAVEKKISEIASERYRTRKSGFYNFNLVNDISRKEEAICGGQIAILVDARPEDNTDIFARIRSSLAEKEPGILITLVNAVNDEVTSLERFWASSPSLQFFPADYIDRASPVVKEMLLVADPEGFCEIDLSQETGHHSFIFFESVFPALRLVIAGAGHIGKSLSHIGRLLGFEVTVIDDRPEYANRENLPDAASIVVGDIGKTLSELHKGHDTFIVIVTRGHKDDAEALRSCIKSDAGYLGMIGSRKKISAIREEFISRGWASESEWNKLHTPIGLEINSRSVEEIAISIAAQLIQVKNSSNEKLKGCPA